MIIKIILTILLIGNSFIYAETTKNNKNSFDDMLSLLKEKEKLEENNNNLEKIIKDLKSKLKTNDEKYKLLSDKYNNIQKTKEENNLKNNELITNEIQGRLPVPYIILNYNNQKVAKVLKLNWYYLVKSDGTTMFNGKYLSDKLKVNDKYLTYMVKNINKDYINYCLITNEKKCIKKYLIDNDIYNSMKSIEIVDGIPDELLVKKNNFQNILSKILSKTNPLTKRIELNKDMEEKIDINNLENIINPKNNGKTSGVKIPKNNIPSFENTKRKK